jgi:hypothetical protein
VYTVEKICVRDRAYTEKPRYEKHPLSFYALSISEHSFGSLNWKRLKATLNGSDGDEARGRLRRRATVRIRLPPP